VGAEGTVGARVWRLHGTGGRAGFWTAGATMVSRSMEVTLKPHWRHWTNGPSMSIANRTSPRHLGQALK